MRALISLFFILLPACATITDTAHNKNRQYEQAIQSWHGSSSKALIASWGTPNQIIHAPHGNSYYVYSTESLMRLPYPDQSRSTTIVGPHGLTTSAGISNQNPTFATIHCTTTFELSPAGVIVSSRYAGADCVVKGGMVKE